MPNLRSWWDKHFLAGQLYITVLIAAAAIGWLEYRDGWEPVTAVLGDNRGSVYGALASIYGALFGFVIAAVAIVMGHITTERFALVRGSSHFEKMLKTFTKAIWALGLATLAALVALVLDREAEPFRFAFYFLVYSSLLAFLRVATATWLLEKVITFAATPKDENSQTRDFSA